MKARIGANRYALENWIDFQRIAISIPAIEGRDRRMKERGKGSKEKREKRKAQEERKARVVEKGKG